jgi:tetratricopeptide (TPR) repeat protein
LATNAPQLAIPPLEKAVGIVPTDTEARGMLAGALMAANRFDQAAAQYRKLTELSPDDTRAWYGLGKTYQGMAMNAFDPLQKQNPTSAYVSALVADTRVQRRQYSSAFFFYHEALKQLPNLHGIHAALADVYRKTGHTDWATAEEAKERELPAPDCKAHAAECQFLGGRDLEAATSPNAAAASAEALFWKVKAANELALQAFTRLGQMPPSVELHQLRAEIARSQNQHPEAVKEWRAALELSPGNPRFAQELAVSLFMAQDFRPAFEQAVALLKSNPSSPELNFIAGDSSLRLEQPEKAVPYLEAALKSDPKLLAAHASLGLALMRTGKSAEAVPHLEKALELDEEGDLHYQLARAYQAAGQSDKARAAMEQYQNILKTSQRQKEEAAREAQIGPPQP